MNSLRPFVKRHQLVSFFVLAYALGWLAGAPATTMYLRGTITSVDDALLFVLLVTCTPLLSAIILTAIAEGRVGVVALLKRLVQWRVNVAWYLVTIYGFFALAWIVVLASGSVSVTNALPMLVRALVSLPLNILFNLWAGPLGEELGWRGYALPRLLARHSALTASLIIGVLWTFWHLPFFVFPDFWFGAQSMYEFALVFVLETCGMAVIYTWLYQRTRGSILIATLFHGAINATQAYFIPRFLPEISATAWGQVAFLWIIAGTLLVIYGPARLSRRTEESLPEPIVATEILS